MRCHVEMEQDRWEWVLLRDVPRVTARATMCRDMPIRLVEEISEWALVEAVDSPVAGAAGETSLMARVNRVGCVTSNMARRFLSHSPIRKWKNRHLRLRLTLFRRNWKSSSNALPQWKSRAEGD